MGKVRFCGVLVFAFLLSAVPKLCQGQFAEDAKWIPPNANCVVLVSGERLFSSQLAQKEDWASRNSGAFQRGTSVIPPNVNRLTIASQFDLTYLQPIWTVMVMKPESGVDLEAVASKNNLTLDTLGDRQAMILPSDLYVCDLDGKVYGAMAPASRQQMARWVESGASGKPSDSPYISEAISFSDRNSDVTIAFDMRHVISEDMARAKLKGFESVPAAEVETAAKALSRLRGVTLGITINDNITGALKIDFMPGTTGIDSIGKKAIIEALENKGIMVDDIRDWKFAANSGSLTLGGPLSDTGIRQINYLVAQPVQALFRGIGLQSAASSEADSAEAATQRYLDKLELFFKEFDEFLVRHRSSSAKAYARWFSTYADQIDMLPAANVDQALLDFGARASEGFRDIAQIMVTADAKSTSQSRSVYGNYNNYYYGYRQGLGGQKAAYKAQNYAAGKIEANKIMSQLKSDFGNVRRSLQLGQ